MISGSHCVGSGIPTGSSKIRTAKAVLPKGKSLFAFCGSVMKRSHLLFALFPVMTVISEVSQKNYGLENNFNIIIAGNFATWLFDSSL